MNIQYTQYNNEVCSNLQEKLRKVVSKKYSEDPKLNNYLKKMNIKRVFYSVRKNNCMLTIPANDKFGDRAIQDYKCITSDKVNFCHSSCTNLTNHLNIALNTFNYDLAKKLVSYAKKELHCTNLDRNINIVPVIKNKN
eukprot:Pgem_evm2s20065